jgi:hypothetical protein
MRENGHESTLVWLKTHPRPIEFEGVRVYRLAHFNLVVGIVGALFFASIGIASVIAAWWNIDGSFRFPHATAIVFGVFWAGFTLLSGYVILAYYRERLFVSDVAVRHQGCFRTRSIVLSEVTRVRWRAAPGGPSIVLRGPEGKIVVYFNQHGTDDDRLALIRFFRDSVDANKQEKWTTFESRFVVRATRPSHSDRVLKSGGRVERSGDPN